MHGAFLQSPEWEQMNKAMGRKTWRVGGVLIIRHNLPRGFNYLYCPRPEFNQITLSRFLSEINQIAKAENSLFLKIDPGEKISFEGINARIGSGRPLQPQKTIVLDLSKSEDDLLGAMHEKTRYNIRLAERKGLEVLKVIHREVKEDFAIFWKLLSETAARQQFSMHQKKHYELLSGIRTDDMSNEFFFAHLRDDHDEMLAAAMVNIYHDPRTGASCATYLHGASSHNRRELMAPHLLHWRIIQDAKQRNIPYYDLWGIDEKKWPGITRFKTGFGGTQMKYPPSLHVIYRPVWYGVYKLIKFITRR